MAIKLDLRWLVAFLIIVVLAMFGFWRPWEQIKSRTIEVVGSTEIKATPDQFTFTPIYQKTAATAKQALSDVSVVGNGVVAGLKNLGISEKSITTNFSNGFSSGTEPGMSDRIVPPTNDETTATYSITVVVNSRELAQKTLDYLFTTPTAYNPGVQTSFATNTRKDLENQARLKATADGRQKAEAMATSLGVDLGKLVKISEVQWGGPIALIEGKPTVSQDTTATPTILPGEQTVSFSVNLTYSLK